MKAYVLHGINDLRFEEVGLPQVKEDEVLVKMKAAGICGSDIPRIYQTGAHRHPLIPGHEFSGQVVEQEYATLEQKAWAGKRVGIFPLIPCRECGPCKIKKFEMCRNYNYLGSRCDGGFAEYVAVPLANLIELPENVSFEEAAMLEPMAVAVHAMRRMNVEKTDRVVVCGLGTIGLLLVMFLKEAGIENLLVIGNKEFQKENILKLGLEESCYCDCRTQDAKEWLLQHTDGAGANVFFECVGKNDTYTLAVDSLAPSGQLMLVGNPYSDMELEKAVYWKILRNQLTVYGTWNSSFTGEDTDDWHYVIERLAKGCIMPSALISHRVSLEELEHGLEIMRDKKEDYVKILGE